MHLHKPPSTGTQQAQIIEISLQIYWKGSRIAFCLTENMDQCTLTFDWESGYRLSSLVEENFKIKKKSQYWQVVLKSDWPKFWKNWRSNITRIKNVKNERLIECHMIAQRLN